MASNHPEALRARQRRAKLRQQFPSPPAVKPSEDETTERRARRLEREVAELRAANTRLLHRLDDAEDLKTSVLGITSSELPPVAWPVDRDRHGRSPHTPILFTSDFQFGEVVRAGELDGMNEFNVDIFAERYTRMIDKTIRWADAISDGWGADYPDGIIYLRGGDAISGEIHAELSETNDFGAVPAVRELARYEAEGIRRLKESFGYCRVVSIPGNHGRITLKPRAKRYVDTNFESILAWWLEASFEREPGVTFTTPESGDAYFTAEGWRFLLSHGDRMGSRGGTGFIGPIATIARGHQKLRMNAAASGRPVDVVLTGHLHTSVKTEWGFANGSLVGYNEYANTLRCEPDAAKQWLLFAHVDRVYGIELELSNKPRRNV